jgi:hypothetical protein
MLRPLAILLLLPAGIAQAQSQKQTRDRHVIRADEVATTSANSAFDVVEQLRPLWLKRDDTRRPMSFGGGRNAGREQPDERAQQNSHGDATPEEPPKLAVFVDETEVELEDLKRIPREQVAELRYLTGAEAQTRYGPRFAAGVIQVTLRTGG